MPSEPLQLPVADAVVTSQDTARRFGGLERLYGVAGARQIRDAHVVVIGIGGVGSWAAEALARSGVGQLTLIDLDHVAESNVNRQVHAVDDTLGQAKVLAMRDRIHTINALCKVVCVEEFVDPDNWVSLVPSSADAVIDACDQVKTKVALAAWAIRSRCAFISVGAAGGKRHAHWVDIADLSLTTHDPLLAQVRQRLRKAHHASAAGKKIGVTCVFSKEEVKKPDATCETTVGGTLNCHGYGSVVSVTASFGMCAAGWVLDKISSRADFASSEPKTRKNQVII